MDDKAFEKGGLYDFSDPKRQGPGSWDYMHNIAAWTEEGDQSQRDIRLEFACQIIERHCKYFKCGDCNGHCTKYIHETNPPRNSIAPKYGLFFWTVNFRNAVNKRIKSPKQYDPQTMLNIYTTPTLMACEEGCGSHEDTTPVAPTPTATKYPDYVDVYVDRKKAPEFTSVATKFQAQVNTQHKTPKISFPQYPPRYYPK